MVFSPSPLPVTLRHPYPPHAPRSSPCWAKVEEFYLNSMGAKTYRLLLQDCHSCEVPGEIFANVAATDRGQSCLPGPCVSWFNPAAVALPQAGTYGNMGVGSLRGPGFWEWDQSISRRFRIAEDHQIEFRAEAFNVTNSLRLGNPNTNMSSGQFGRITSSTNANGVTGNGGRIMQFALKYIF